MPDNEREDVCYTQPRSTPQRLAIARDFVKRFDYPLPMLVDSIENRANEVYAGWPERLLIIDEQGRVAYKGKPGPFGYHPEELADWLSHRFPRS